jgi:hypothetical protein
MKLNTRALAACDRVATGIANFLGIQESTARNLVTSGASALMAVGVMFLSGDPLTGFAGIIPGMARIAGADTKTLIFKGQELHVGDFIAFQSPLIPLPEIQAAVIDVKDGVLEIVSTLIAPFRQGGKFKETDVTSEIVIVYPAEEAIKKESRSWNFSKGQRVRVTVKGGEVMEGNVIAAFDGVIVAQRDDGLYITGGASFFKKVEEDRP